MLWKTSMKFHQSIFFKFLLLFFLPFSLYANNLASNFNDHKADTSSFVTSLTPEELKWLDKNQSLNYVYDPDWAPFEWKNDIGQHTGIISDILHIIEHKTGINLVATNTKTWEESIKLAKNAKIDMLSAITINNDREKYLNFTSKTIFSYPAVLVTRFTDKTVYLDIKKDIKNKKIGIVKSSGLGSYIKEKNPNLNFIEIPSTKEGFSLLSNNEIDLFAINMVTARYFIEKKGFNDLKIVLKLDYTYHLKLAIIKKLPPEVITILDKVLNSISEDELNNIFNKWTEISTVKQTDWKFILQLLSFVFILLLFFLWNTRRLKLMVKNRTKELNIQKERLLEAQRIANIGHWEWDITQNRLQWSDEIYRIFGLNPKTFKVDYEAFLSLIHPDDKDWVKESVNKALNHEQTYDIEHRMILIDNSEKFVRQRAEVQFDEHGKPLRMLGTVHDISEQKRLEAELKHLSNHDPLTGLPNRRHLVIDFDYESKRAIRYNRKMALYYVDLNKFKKINDELGHEVGDELLQYISNKAKNSLRENKTIYRVGGDEFCILVPELKNKDELIMLAERIIKDISNIDHFGGMEIEIGCSIGIAIFPDNGKTLSGLTSSADEAMYLIKNSDKGNFCFAEK